MKKITLLFSAIFLLHFSHSIAGTFTSLGVGPANWNGGATSWTIVGDADGVIDGDDNVTVQAGHTISANVTGICLNLTVDGTLSFITTGNISINGDYTVNGTESGAGNINFAGPFLPLKSISGTGVFGPNMRWTFVRDRNIASNVTATRVNRTRINPGIIVHNFGNMGIRQVELYAGCSWVNETGSTLSINTDATFFTGIYSGIGTFDASPVGNTVIINSANINIPITSAGYYNLTLAFPTSGVKKLVANTTILNNLTINVNNTLNCNGFDLIVQGNWIKNGLFIGSTGKAVIFNGTAAQTLSGAGTATFTGLTIDNTAGVTLSSGSYAISEVLTLLNGTFNTGGRPCTMLSTATSTARIAPVTGTGAVAGNFTVQRHISGRDTTYCDLSSPVNNSTFLDWDNELPAISYIAPVSGASQGSASTYDETGDVYVAVTSSSQPLLPGQGFEVYLAGSFSYAAFPTTTLTTVGELTVGDQDLSSLVSANVQGWNLVGNPFASSISWASVYAASGGASSGLYDYIEMFDYTINDWADVTADDEIVSTQGFWVYSDFTATPTLFILESCKTNTGVFDIRTSKKSAPYFTLKLANAANTCAHNFKVTATPDGFDGYDRKDLPFRNSPVKATPAMYTMVEGKKINTNTFNSNNDSYSMPLKTQVNVSGTYTITASGFEFISDYTCIKLQDKYTGQIVDLNEGNGYCFTMNTADSPDRFILVFSKDSNCKSAIVASSPNVDFNNQVEILPSAQGNVINFNLGETTNTTISVLNVLGQTIVEGINLDAANQSINIALPEGFNGLYFVKIESQKGTVTKKFVRK